jgi:putative ABC transport system ATP-binding protein
MNKPVAQHDVPLLSSSAVTKTFRANPALRGGEMQVSAGEIVAVMGPSGAGKSTLLHCLAGIVRPDSGTITYDGRRIDALSDNARALLRRTEFGFVFQFGQLVPELTALENVTLPLLLAGRGRRDARVVARRWLATFGVEETADRRPGDLSGGQAQRIAVARAMVTDPRVVFADEPTGSLDTAAGIAVLEAFTSVARSANVAVVVVTHESRVAAYADRTVVVRDGIVAGPSRPARSTSQGAPQRPGMTGTVSTERVWR